METNIKLRILNSIGNIYEESNSCKLEESFFQNIDCDLQLLSNYFETNKRQSFLIAMVFALNYKGETVDFTKLIKYFDCNPTKIAQYIDDFSYICSSGIIEKKTVRDNKKLAIVTDQFKINEKISNAILNNEPRPTITDNKISDIFNLLENIHKLREQCSDNEITASEFFNKASKLIAISSHFPLIKKIQRLKLNNFDTYVYLFLIWEAILGDNYVEISKTLDGIFESTKDWFNYKEKLISGETPLIKYQLIEIDDTFSKRNPDLMLSEKSFDILKKCDINISIKKMKSENLISPQTIPFRKLIFNESEMEQLFLLKKVLKNGKFTGMQKRLTEKNLSKGIAVLLHGLPGTGKTEIVKQIAKETNREIMKVEISQTKSMFFGGSEKKIKKIFTDYETVCKERKVTPILFLNEADAIISKRKEVNDSNLAQTENTIQNIILEELENFKGILIATTNLVNNLDKAFERRFLFKINFQKPEVAIRAKIWALKLPFLPKNNCNLLAEMFDFSGGQIDNVLRKSEIHQVIYNEQVTLEKLITFCSEETLESTRSKIGFQ